MHDIKPFNQNAGRQISKEALKCFEEIILSGNFVLGKYTNKLETMISNLYVGASVIAMNSGTVALECMFEFLHQYRNVKKVAVPSSTNFATVSSIIRSGSEPIFVDCDENGQMSLTSLMNLTNSIEIGAVIIVHIGGYVSKDIDEILTFCKKNDYIFLEDCAHAHGSKYNGRLLGTLGFASILSFFPTKLVNGAEGGALITFDEDLAAFASKWRNQGKSGTFGNHHEVLGGSYRMSEFNCALAVLNYNLLDNEIQKRMSLSADLISSCGHINFSKFDHMDIFSCYKLIATHPNYSGEEVELKLKSKGVFCGGAVYRSACHSQPVFSYIPLNISLDNTEIFSNKHFCLPVHSGISSDDLDRIKNSLIDL